MKRVLSFLMIIGFMFGLLFCNTKTAYANQLLDMDDGVYAIEVTLEGGSGKATVVSPCKLQIIDGQGYATLEWSSPNYDYMIVNGEKYLPINEEGNSTFEIPILVYNDKMPVIADTTAMGTPHEVNYELTFPTSGIMGANETPQARARYSVYIALGIIALCICVSQAQRRYKLKKMRELSQKKRSK